MPVARSRSGLSTRLSERQRKQLYGDTDTPAQSAGRKGKQALQERLRQLRSQGPMVLLELINVAPATLLKPWQHTDLMVRVRDVWPEAPTPELTLLAGGIDHELEELAGHLRLSIYGLATMPRSFCQGTERLVMVARNVVDGEERSLLEAAKCGGPLEGLRTTLRQAGEHTRRPARIFAQAILKALEHAPAAWQARVRRCAYLPCPRPFFWDATDNARRRYCSKRHANAFYRTRDRVQIGSRRKGRPSRAAQLRQARIDRERTAQCRAARAAARRDDRAYVQRLADREARYGEQYAARIHAAAKGRA